jgi:hypothetical protein
MNSQIHDRFSANVARVRHLVTIYDAHSGTGQGRRPVNSSDVLRAAVVLLHAAIEDVLRSLERRTLPHSSAEILNDVPLIGLQRPTKFFLGDLVAHKGKTIQTLLDESVENHLLRSTYNNAEELASVLRRLGADPVRFRTHFEPLEGMMKRRHQIVHRADRDESPGSGHHVALSLSRTKVLEWVDSAEAFVQDVFVAIPDIGGPAP